MMSYRKRKDPVYVSLRGSLTLRTEGVCALCTVVRKDSGERL